MKILPEGAELYRMDGQTGVTKTTVAFRSFAKAPNKTGTRMTSAGFEHAILTIRRFQTYVLDRTATGIATSLNNRRLLCHHHRASYSFFHHRSSTLYNIGK
jgi:hypothetical protein